MAKGKRSPSGESWTGNRRARLDPLLKPNDVGIGSENIMKRFSYNYDKINAWIIWGKRRHIINNIIIAIMLVLHTTLGSLLNSTS
jgi:hypothetical protein